MLDLVLLTLWPHLLAFNQCFVKVRRSMNFTILMKIDCLLRQLFHKKKKIIIFYPSTEDFFMIILTQNYMLGLELF